MKYSKMVEKRIQELETGAAVAHERYEHLMSKIDEMPKAIVNEVRLIMIEEARKTSDGLGKDVANLKNNQKWIILIGSAISTGIGKLLNLF